MFTIPFPLGDLAPVGVAPIRLEGTVALAAGVSADWTVAISYHLPKNARGVIDGFGWAARAAFTYDGGAAWQLAINNQSYQIGSQVNQRMLIQHGTPQVPARTMILLEPGDLVELLVRRVVAALGVDTFDHVLTGIRWRAELNVQEEG